MLKLLGFRYSVGRDAYVLRVVGNRFGPVFRTSIEAPAFSEKPAPPIRREPPTWPDVVAPASELP